MRVYLLLSRPLSIQSSMVFFVLNFFPARSAALNLNWFPYNSKTICGIALKSIGFCVSLPSGETVFVPVTGRTSYRGIQREKMTPCFGSTVIKSISHQITNDIKCNTTHVSLDSSVLSL